MSIKLINSRRRLNHKNAYNAPHKRNNRNLAQISHQKRVERNKEKKRAKLDHMKNKNKPKSRKPKENKMPYRFKYYQFQNYKFKTELEELDKI